jgi:hypothetical protein
MLTPAMIVFSVSLVGILVLFILKKIETNREARFVEGVRARADQGALVVKHWFQISEWYLERAPWFVSALTRYGVHIGALSFARLARTLESRAHQLADLVSHKHRFERRATKSQFLKEVGEYKNGKDDKDGGVATM